MTSSKNWNWYIRLLDSGAAIAAIAIAITVILLYVPFGIEKARFMEVVLALELGKVALSEQQAIGESQPIKAPPPDNIAGKYELWGRIEGDAYLLTGKHHKSGKPFFLSIAPSVIQGEPSGSIQWLCGHHGARSGWSGPLQGAGTDLPATQIPFICRARLHGDTL